MTEPTLIRPVRAAHQPSAVATEAEALCAEIEACRLCSERFAGTATAHAPRPVPWFDRRARILIAGQAPGARVHRSGRPFTDPSGDRLRDWLGLAEAEFYDRSRVAIVPMAFCFPGYDAKGSDLPPPPLCAHTWRARVLAAMPDLAVTVLVGGHAQRWHLGRKITVSEAVAGWRDTAPAVWPLPHPSWRTIGWQRRHPAFATELLPALRRAIRLTLGDGP